MYHPVHRDGPVHHKDQNIENQVNELKKKTPAPTERNYAPIEANTKLYKEAADKLAVLIATAPLESSG